MTPVTQTGGTEGLNGAQRAFRREGDAHHRAFAGVAWEPLFFRGYKGKKFFKKSLGVQGPMVSSRMAFR